MESLIRKKALPLILVSVVFFLFGYYSNVCRYHEFVRCYPSSFKIPRGYQHSTNVQFRTMFNRPTPAERRLNMMNRKCNVFTQMDKTPYTKANLKFSLGKAVIFVYNISERISKEIMHDGGWERKFVRILETVFYIDPKMNLIDIGCNVGVYTLVGAMRNRKVIAVDANIENIRRLKKSLVTNKVDKNVKLLYNAISDRYAKFSITSEKGNIGRTFLSKLRSSETHPVKSIYLDDILEVADFNRAILKIDIEGHEHEAFHQADKLFTEIDIPLVMMEWLWTVKHTNRSAPTSVIAFFTKFGYKAYKHMFQDIPLDNKQFKAWPNDIVWKRTS